MSMDIAASVSAGAASSFDGGKAAKGKADADNAFAAMIAGAGDAPTPDAATQRDVRGNAKGPSATRDDDDSAHDDDKAVAALNGIAPLPVSPPAPAAIVASGEAPIRSGKPAQGESPRPTPSAVAMPEAKSIGDPVLSAVDATPFAADGALAAAATPVVADAQSDTGATPAGADAMPSAVDATDPKLAPVLAALAASLAAKQAHGEPAAPPAVPASTPIVPTPAAPSPVASEEAAPVAIPATATAALMASRITPKGTPFSGRADARPPVAAGRKRSDDPDADSPDAALDTPVSSTATPTSVVVATIASNGHAAPSNDAASQLASGAADRQLDLARQGAWLDGIAHDIAATGAGGGPLRFEVAPQHLGTVQVEMTRGGDGTTVALTASSEASRAALADARPQLVTEARNHGLHIVNATVDIGNGQAGSSDSRQPAPGQGESRSSSNSASGNGDFSAQANTQGDSGRQSQTRSQPLVANAVAGSGSPDADAAPEPSDGLYA